MRVVYMGTPQFAVAPLEALINSRHEVLAVVCQPDRERDKKGNIIPPAVKECALKYGIEVFQFEKIKEEGIDVLARLEPDIMVTAAYGQILSDDILRIAKHGVINVHGSLLPKYRGSSPVQQAVIDGESETGITIMQTQLGLDCGDIISVEKTRIERGETAGELLVRLSSIGARLLIKTLDEIESGTAKWTGQNHELATRCRLIKKTDGLIDFTKCAGEIVNFIHGMNPWPLAYSFLSSKRISVFRAEIFEGILPRRFFKAGEIYISGGELVVATGGGFIRLIEVQAEGKKRMLGSEMARGLHLGIGQGFSNER